MIDATGLGAGLASFLGNALGGGIVVPFVFTQKSKSDLGWACELRSLNTFARL